MTARILPDEFDQAVDVVFETKKRLEWVVREDPKLQAELNNQPKKRRNCPPRLLTEF